MMGKDFWEDAEIDAIVIEQEIDRLADLLYEQYKGTFDEIDILQMNNPILDARSLILLKVLERAKNDTIIRSPGL